MCVGFTNGFEDFPPPRHYEALNALVPGSAVGFDRIGYYHFAIYLGKAWPKGGESEPIPLICHLTGDATTKASVRLSDFRNVANNSTVRVYQCSCTAAKRSEVIYGCLYRVGTEGYNIVTNNCEHFVREVITGEGISYQAIMTLLVPFVQLPRLIAGGAIGGTIHASASASASCDAGKMDNYRSLGLINPVMELLEIFVSNHGLNLKGLKKNSSCTRDFACSTHFPMQMLFFCETCSIEGKQGVCISCRQFCHEDKGCQTWGGRVCDDLCSCMHDKRTAGLLSVRKEEIKHRLQGSRSPRTFEYSFEPDC